MRASKLVIVTGATSGIGAAVAQAFAAAGDRLFLIGRNERRLASAAGRIPTRRLAGTAIADLGSVADIRGLLSVLSAELTRAHVLVHAAGEYAWTKTGSVETETFDLLFNVNVRGPYLLTQGLMRLLQRSRGQVIFLNSSIVQSRGEGAAAFKATQHAVQGLVDSLRHDFNRRGIRVSSLFPGRTATPRMRRIYTREGRRYSPRLLLRARDVARLVVALSELPARVEITNVQLRSLMPY